MTRRWARAVSREVLPMHDAVAERAQYFERRVFDDGLGERRGSHLCKLSIQRSRCTVRFVYRGPLWKLESLFSMVLDLSTWLW
jgi:hypothetical protein